MENTKVDKYHIKLVKKAVSYIKSLFYKVADFNIGLEDEDPFLHRLNVIDKGSEIWGDSKFEHNCRVSGTINGDVICVNKIVIDSNGKVNGNIYASEILVNGTVTKNLYCEGQIKLTKHSKVLGDIYTVQIEVTPEANFKGIISKERIDDIEKHWTNRNKK